jgi:hypothetical protein
LGFEGFFILFQEKVGSRRDQRVRSPRSVNELLVTGNDMEVRMVLIKVQFDAYNRQFKLIDRDLVHALADGETYVLIADVSLEDLDPRHGAEIQSKLEPVSV